MYADARILRVEIREAQIAGRKIKLFVIERIVGNVHLAVLPEETSIGIQNGASVVIHARRTAFEKGYDERDFLFFGDLRQSFRRGPGHGFR